MELNFGIVEGLPDEEQRQLRELKYIYDYHRTTNRKKRRYYNGKITLQEVNLGIALPYGMTGVQTCALPIYFRMGFEGYRLVVPGVQKPWMYWQPDQCLMGL